MLYVIGGVPRSGKSKLARRMFNELGYPVLTTDVFISMFMRVAPDLKINYGHSDRCRKIAPGLKASVRQLVNNNDNYVLEGELLDPWLVEQLTEVAELRACFLAMSKPSIELIIEHEGGNAWVCKLDDAERLRTLDAIVEINTELVAECEKHGSRVFDVSLGEYDEVVDAAFDYLTRP